MNIQALERERKNFNRVYEVNYPKPTPKSDDTQSQSSVLLWAWGVVSIAGAIISFPHTMKAIMQSVPEITGALAFVYAGAVFVGVELALLIVAFTEAHSNIKNPRPRRVMTLRTLLSSIVYRLGLSGKPQPETTNETSMTGLLMALVVSAILFNLADTTQSQFLQSIIKFVSGLLAPMLLFLAGHEFANQIATRLLADQIRQRHADEALNQWEQRRDEAWLAHYQTLTTKKGSDVGSDVKTDPLAVNTAKSSYPEWARDTQNGTTILMKNGG